MSLLIYMKLFDKSLAEICCYIFEKHNCIPNRGNGVLAVFNARTTETTMEKKGDLHYNIADE